MNTSKKNIVIGILIVVLIGGGAFYGGMKYAQGASVNTRDSFGNISSAPRQALFQQNGGIQGTGRGMRNGGGFSSGQIISKDDKSITLKLKNGGSEIVFLTPETPVLKTTEGAQSDLTIGTNVVVTGTANQDGSISAQSVQLRNLPSNAQSGTVTQ